MFRKPSIRIVAAEGRSTKSKEPVELRALTSYLEEDGEEEEDWRAGEEKFKEDRERQAQEADRKRKIAQIRDHSGRRMTVDGRILKV